MVLKESREKGAPPVRTRLAEPQVLAIGADHWAAGCRCYETRAALAASSRHGRHLAACCLRRLLLRRVLQEQQEGQQEVLQQQQTRRPAVPCAAAVGWNRRCCRKGQEHVGVGERGMQQG
jgi:hypothetical protein